MVGAPRKSDLTQPLLADRCAKPSDALANRASLASRDPLVSHARDPAFAAPAECTARTRQAVDTYNHMHRSWQARKLFTVDSRMTGFRSPLSIVNTRRERKSPNPLFNRLRRWSNAPVTDAQAKARARLRLVRDGFLATLRYYGLDPHEFNLPTDADLLEWSPKKAANLFKAARLQLAEQVMALEMPEAKDTAANSRPRINLRLQVHRDAQSHTSAEECYVAFSAPKPFWRREGDPLFCVPIFATSARGAALFAGPSPAQTFAKNGPVRYERRDVGQFVPREN